MSFQSIPPIEDYQFFLDLAFSRAKKRASVLRSSLRDEKLDKSRKIEQARISVVGDVLSDRMFQIVQAFPSLDQLTPFYLALVKITLDYPDVKRSLGSTHWAGKTSLSLSKEYSRRVRKAQTVKQMNDIRREYYGRVSSLIKEISKNLKLLENARKVIIQFPVIKQMPTVCITGFPNVGKTTLLSKLTGSRPDIKPYAFTTKGLNFGYTIIEDKKIQFIDTPGTLARPDKMNIIEQIAYLAMKMTGEILIYVWDITEPFPMEDQERLFKEIKKLKKPIFEYLSKTDIVDQEKVKEFCKKRKRVITDIEVLKKEIISAISKEEINS